MSGHCSEREQSLEGPALGSPRGGGHAPGLGTPRWWWGIRRERCEAEAPAAPAAPGAAGLPARTTPPGSPKSSRLSLGFEPWRPSCWLKFPTAIGCGRAVTSARRGAGERRRAEPGKGSVRAATALEA